MRSTNIAPILGLAFATCLAACGDDGPPGSAGSDPVVVDFGSSGIDTDEVVATGDVTFAISADDELDAPQIQLLALAADTEEDALAAALRDGDPAAALELAAPAGGIDLDGGRTTELTIELDPGRYLWLDPDTGAASDVFTARGDAVEAPAVDGVVELGDLTIGLPPDFGQGTYRLETTDGAIHGLTIIALEEAVADDELLRLFEEDADLPGVEVVRAGNLGPDRRQSVTLDLPPGRYVAASYFPDFERGALQAALGMFATFTVEGDR